MAKKKIRPTINNARAGKNGVFLPKHLDGPTGKAAQMDGLLHTWHCYKATYGGDFEWAEQFFYKNHFTDGLEYQNAKHRKKGNYGRVKEMDDYRTSEKTCPESTLYYLGDRYHNAGPDVLEVAVMEFLMWREKEYPQVVTVDWAVHQEDGAPHVHERHVWIAHDDAGHDIVCQEKALEEMGVPRHDEVKYKADMAAALKIKDKKKQASKISQINRYNNRKMTYTEACREKMIEIARSYGIEVEDKPREPGQKGLSQARFKAQDEQHKAEHYARHGKRLRAALQDDVRSAEARDARQSAAAFLASMGAAAVRPVLLPTPETLLEIDDAMEQHGETDAGEPIRSAVMQRAFAMAKRQKTAPGPNPVEGPSL